MVASSPCVDEAAIGLRRLTFARLDEQVAADHEPVPRAGNDPALYVETVGATVERGRQFIVSGLARHQRDRVGRDIGSIGHDDVEPDPAGRAVVGRTDRRRTPAHRKVRRCAGRNRRRPDRRRWRVVRRRPTEPPEPHRHRPHHSTDRGRPGAVEPSSAACSTRNSVRRLGTNTPRATAMRSPQKSAQPSTYSNGSPGRAPHDAVLEFGRGAAGLHNQRGLVLGEHATRGPQAHHDRRQWIGRHVTAGPALVRPSSSPPPSSDG